MKSTASESRTSNGLTPLEDLSLADKAYEALREAILGLTLKPGEPLVEQRLATALGTSKTPIRQALHRLEQTGLVRGVPGRGYYVAQLTLRDAREILEIRAALEGMAVAQACTHLSGADLHELHERLHSAQAACDDRQSDLCAELGHQFHQALIDKADNERLSFLIGTYSDQYHRVRLVSRQNPGRLPKSIAEHAQIFSALEARDAARAEHAMRCHLLAVYEDLKDDSSLTPDLAFA